MKTLILAPLILLVGCNYNHLTPLARVNAEAAGYAEVDAHFCTSAPMAAQQNVKYLFILDHSGSNQPGIPSALTPNDVSNTDSQGARRYGPLVTFVNSLSSSASVMTSFALIDFNDTAAQIGAVTGFDGSQSNFVNTVDTDWIGTGTASAPSPEDSGFTNYQAALNLALTLITSDAQNAAALSGNVSASYVIVFVSDGIPTISDSSQPGGTYTQNFASDISPVIADIMALKSNTTLGPYINSIQINTAFYSTAATLTTGQQTQVQAAKGLLGQMATAGNGQYVAFDSGQNVLYQEFAPAQTAVVNSLADVFVTNQNMVWWDDGRLLADSDGDGLPDVIETQLGSNPFAADSDGNGVNDLVEYRTKGVPCQDSACSATNRYPYAICAGYTPVTASDGTVTFHSSSNDGLNDCEKYVLGATPTLFNSNGDLIPDDMGLRTDLPIVPGSSATAFSDPFNDGMTNYQKIKAGLPVQVSMKTLEGVTQQSTELVQEASTAANVSCYHLVVSNVPINNVTNNLKVYLVQNQSTLTNKPFLMTASAYLASGSSVLSFQPGDFK